MKYVPRRRTGVHWPVENTNAELLTDLQHCESCLAEAEREVERLERENKVIKTCDTKNEASYKAMLMAVHRIAELVGMDISNSPAEIVDKVKQLLNSEGRAGK